MVRRKLTCRATFRAALEPVKGGHRVARLVSRAASTEDPSHLHLKQVPGLLLCSSLPEFSQDYAIVALPPSQPPYTFIMLFHGIVASAALAVTTSATPLVQRDHCLGTLNDNGEGAEVAIAGYMATQNPQPQAQARKSAQGRNVRVKPRILRQDARQGHRATRRRNVLGTRTRFLPVCTL